MLFILTSFLSSGLLAKKTEDIFEAFENPDKQYGPFVRWWWNGTRAEPVEIARQLDIMDAAGIGGVEINSIAMPDQVPAESLNIAPELEWLSKEWTDVVLAAVDESRERGMTPDIIIGSGWPFGGEFLKPEHRIKRVRSLVIEVGGPGVYEADKDKLWDLLAENDHILGAEGRNDYRPERLEVIDLQLLDKTKTNLYPKSITLNLAEVYDREAGLIRITVPEGYYSLHAVLLEQDYTAVKHGSLGASGPVLDHMNQAAVLSFLNNMSDKITQHTDLDMGELFRATFIDSLELSHSNWAYDFPERFKERRGYDIFDWLGYILAEPDEEWHAAFAEDVKRAKYDYYSVLVELFEERFITTYADWAEEHGIDSRFQTYGRLAHPLNGSLIPTIPEGETWIWEGFTENPPSVVMDSTFINKYVSSAAHLAGRDTITFEAITNAVPVFRESLEDFKLGMDISVLDGLNHPVMHGYNYTPVEAGFPGWVRFGVYLNERTPFWPHFKRFSDYVSRLSMVLRNSENIASVGILTARGEEWERAGLQYYPFPTDHYPWYEYLMARAFQKVGVGTDYLSEEVIQDAKIRGGELRYNDRRYELLVLLSVSALQTDTAEKIADFVAKGGKVVFLDQLPNRGLGLMHQGEKKQAVSKAIHRAREDGAFFLQAPDAPEILPDFTNRNQRGFPVDYSGLIALSEQILEKTGVEKQVNIVNPDSYLSQVNHIDRNGNHYFFFANKHRTEPVESELTFSNEKKNPLDMNLHTGQITSSPHWSEGIYHLKLGPLESRLIVIPAKSKKGGDKVQNKDKPSHAKTLDFNGPWELTFKTVDNGPVFSRTLDTLSDLSLSEDPQVSSFSGAVHYKNQFTLDTLPASAAIDLGFLRGTTTLIVNGQTVGTHWYGQHRYELRDVLKEGSNEVEIVVTTTLANYMRTKKDDPMAQRFSFWFNPTRMGIEQDIQVKLYE